MEQKNQKELNNQAKWFINYLSRVASLDKDIKNNLFDTFNISWWITWFLHILWTTILPTNRKDAVSTLCKMFNLLIVDKNLDELKPFKKIHLKKNEPAEHYLDLAHKDFGNLLPSNEDYVVVAYRIYDKYKEYLEKIRANQTTLWHTLKYGTFIQDIKHRRNVWNKVNLRKNKFGKGDYFLDSTEQFVEMGKNKTEWEKTLSINKYFTPIWIRVKKTTENTVKDMESLNRNNISLPPIIIKPGDYMVEVDISPHVYESGKPLKEAYKKLQKYLHSQVYDDIIADAKRMGKEIKKEDIHIPFLFWISALTTFAKAGGWDIRNIPVKDAKRTSTYMYGLINPHTKYNPFEQPLILNAMGLVDKKSKMAYKQLEKMSDKFDVRDIGFTSIPLDKFLDTDMEQK